MYPTYHNSTFGTQFTQQRHKDIAAGKEGIAFKLILTYRMLREICNQCILPRYMWRNISNIVPYMKFFKQMKVAPLNNLYDIPYMTRTGARDPSARLLSRDKSKPDDSDDEISIPTPSGEIPDSQTVFHKPPKPPKSKYTSFKVGKKIVKEETAKLEEMSAKLRVDWEFLEQKLAERRFANNRL